MKSYKRKIKDLEQAIQTWIQLSSKMNNAQYDSQRANFQGVLTKKLKEALHNENEAHEIAINKHISNGYTSKLSIDATIITILKNYNHFYQRITFEILTLF